MVVYLKDPIPLHCDNKIIIHIARNSVFHEQTTSAEWAFGPGCFCYSASVLEPRHIGVRPKGMTFGLGC